MINFLIKSTRRPHDLHYNNGQSRAPGLSNLLLHFWERTPVHARKYGREFEESVSDILIHPYFQSLKAYVHHGKKRYEHSVYVAYNTYVMAKKCGLDAEAAGRGALLHDFFFDRTPEQKKEFKPQQKTKKMCQKDFGTNR